MPALRPDPPSPALFRSRCFTTAVEAASSLSPMITTTWAPIFAAHLKPALSDRPVTSTGAETPASRSPRVMPDPRPRLPPPIGRMATTGRPEDSFFKCLRQHFHQSVLADGKPDPRHLRTTEVGDQTIVPTTATDHGVLTEFGRYDFEDGPQVVVEPAHQSRRTAELDAKGIRPSSTCFDVISCRVAHRVGHRCGRSNQFTAPRHLAVENPQRVGVPAALTVSAEFLPIGSEFGLQSPR